MKRSDLVLTLGQRLFLLMCMFLICYGLTMVLSFVLGNVFAARPAVALRMSAMVQDVVAFIVPAVATSVIVCRNPAALLCLSTPRLKMMVLVMAMLFVSVPVQEAVIYWNYNISLPESMSGFESMSRSLENAAFATLKVMLGDTGIGSLILNLLIIGVAAGFAEELLFRGCFQRLLVTGGVNVHVAIWLVAFVFSALHMQFFGFVPRMLLGAYFGYLLLWSGSIWVPVIAHTLNNMIYVLAMWNQVRHSGMEALSNDPSLWNIWATLGSAVFTVGVLFLMWKLRDSGKHSGYAA